MIYSTIHTSDGTIGIIHIGLGLVGAAIDQAFTPYLIDRNVYKLDWSNQEQLLTTISEVLIEIPNAQAYEIIWSAGKAGFSASQEEISIELDSFNHIMRLLSHSLRSKITRFWLISSAGGLHEGQICVNNKDQAEPKRPYAWLKLQQEKLVQSVWNSHIICRVSSVYTISNLSGRMGLVAVMMLNAIQHRVTTLVGGESTQRDYVLDRDIGSSIFDAIRSRSKSQGIQYFISGTPLSIKTIKNSIENITFKKLYVKYAKHQSNATSITFSPSLKSPIFHSSPFNANMKRLYYSITSNRI